MANSGKVSCDLCDPSEDFMQSQAVLFTRMNLTADVLRQFTQEGRRPKDLAEVSQYG